MEKIDTVYKRRTWTIHAKLFKMRKRWRSSFKISHSLILCFAFRLCKVEYFFVVVVFISPFSHFTYLTSTILYWGYVVQAVANFLQCTSYLKKEKLSPRPKTNNIDWLYNKAINEDWDGQWTVPLKSMNIFKELRPLGLSRNLFSPTKTRLRDEQQERVRCRSRMT